jgi:hypothetical protein
MDFVNKDYRKDNNKDSMSDKRENNKRDDIKDIKRNDKSLKFEV